MARTERIEQTHLLRFALSSLFLAAAVAREMGWNLAATAFVASASILGIVARALKDRVVAVEAVETLPDSPSAALAMDSSMPARRRGPSEAALFAAGTCLGAAIVLTAVAQSPSRRRPRRIYWTSPAR
jgi:hypothetical protein